MSIYQDWIVAKSELIRIKEKERKLRDKIEAELRADQERYGVVRKDIDGYRFVSKVSLRYTLDVKTFLSLESSLSDEDMRAIDFKPVLNVATYKKLPEDSKLRKIVTVVPSAPQLSVEN